MAQEVFDVDSSIASSNQITLASTPSNDVVSWNGVVLTKGSSRDYTISGTTVTFDSGMDLRVGDLIAIRYD